MPNAMRGSLQLCANASAIQIYAWRRARFKQTCGYATDPQCAPAAEWQLFGRVFRPWWITATATNECSDRLCRSPFVKICVSLRVLELPLLPRQSGRRLDGRRVRCRASGIALRFHIFPRCNFSRDFEKSLCLCFFSLFKRDR